jgi:2-polyprenyl-3-methyl-5-hydroxy-6-metoxy-1,4-benzoquinol methylase
VTTDDSSKYDASVDPDAPNNSHGITLQLTGFNKRVLELGAAGGHMTRALIDRGNSVVPVEFDARNRNRLRELSPDAIFSDLNWLDLNSRWKSEFDVVLAADVLEHVVHPDLVLRSLRSLVNESGYLILSVPNVAHGDIRLRLLAGHFEYTDVGLLDSSHLRFFTRESVVNLLEETGYQVEEVFTTTVPIGSTEQNIEDLDVPSCCIDYVQTQRDAVVYQFIVKARPHFSNSLDGSPDALSQTTSVPVDAQVEELLEMLSLVHHANRQLQSELNECKSELNDCKSELNDCKSELERGILQIAEEKLHLEDARAVVTRAEQLKQEIEDVQFALAVSRNEVAKGKAEVKLLRSLLNRL